MGSKPENAVEHSLRAKNTALQTSLELLARPALPEEQLHYLIDSFDTFNEGAPCGDQPSSIAATLLTMGIFKRPKIMYPLIRANHIDMSKFVEYLKTQIEFLPSTATNTKAYLTILTSKIWIDQQPETSDWMNLRAQMPGCIAEILEHLPGTHLSAAIPILLTRREAADDPIASTTNPNIVTTASLIKTLHANGYLEVSLSAMQ